MTSESDDNATVILMLLMIIYDGENDHFDEIFQMKSVPPVQQQLPYHQLHVQRVSPKENKKQLSLETPTTKMVQTMNST